MVLKRLKLPKIFNGVARTFPTHKHMGVLAPVEKRLEESSSAPLEKLLPKPMHTSM